MTKGESEEAMLKGGPQSNDAIRQHQQKFNLSYLCRANNFAQCKAIFKCNQIIIYIVGK